MLIEVTTHNVLRTCSTNKLSAIVQNANMSTFMVSRTYLFHLNTTLSVHWLHWQWLQWMWQTLIVEWEGKWVIPCTIWYRNPTPIPDIAKLYVGHSFYSSHNMWNSYVVTTVSVQRPPTLSFNWAPASLLLYMCTPSTDTWRNCCSSKYCSLSLAFRIM